MSQGNEVKQNFETAQRQSGLDPANIELWEQWLSASFEGYLRNRKGRMSFSPYERFFGRDSALGEELNEFVDGLPPLQRNEFNHALVLRIAKIEVEEGGFNDLELLIYVASRQRLTAAIEVLTQKTRMHGSNETFLNLVFGALGQLTVFAGIEHPHTQLSIELVQALAQAEAFQKEWAPATLICLNNLQPSELVSNLQILRDHLDAELNSQIVSDDGNVVSIAAQVRHDSIVDEILKVSNPYLVLASMDSSFLVGANNQFMWWTIAVSRTLRKNKPLTAISPFKARDTEQVYDFPRSAMIVAAQTIKQSGWV